MIGLSVFVNILTDIKFSWLQLWMCSTKFSIWKCSTKCKVNPPKIAVNTHHGSIMNLIVLK